MPSSSNLENLAKIGQLKAEPPSQSEIDGLVASGRKRLKDAQNPANALESRFDLAYSAAHAFSLAALRARGYRSQNRYLVFQVLPYTLGMTDRQWRLLALCHERRDRRGYRCRARRGHGSGAAEAGRTGLACELTLPGISLASPI